MAERGFPAYNAVKNRKLPRAADCGFVWIGAASSMRAPTAEKEEQMEKYTTKFFAAANTEGGFFSLFGEIFPPERMNRIYILKGGPGTGKSTLMKSVGFAAEANGYPVEYYYCSSDTGSLDGVLIPSLGVAVIDGTAPHMTDPVYPGAVERIVNLGDAFDFSGLEEQRQRLISLISEKRDSYRTAYRYLSAAGRMEREIAELAMPAFLTEKADAAAARLLSSMKKAKSGGISHRYLSAIGTSGRVTFDTFCRKAEKTYAVTDKYGLGYLFMSRLRMALEHAGISVVICPAPLLPSRTEGIFVDGENVFFAVCDEAEAASFDKTVNISRFISREGLAAHRGRLRFSEKCAASLMEGAMAALADAGRFHAEAEKIYGEFIDFSKVDSIRNAIISEIFANNM